MVLVRESSAGQGSLEAAGVRPCVLRAAHAPALPDVEHGDDLPRRERRQESLDVESVDPDRRDRSSFIEGGSGYRVRHGRVDPYPEPASPKRATAAATEPADSRCPPLPRAFP